MSEKLWNEFEKFWDKNEIERMAEEYQYLYEHPENADDFCWVNEKDKLNTNSKAICWGVPNHILGDIDKAKVIVGLLNPGTHMESEVSEKCETVGDYIKNEMNKEMGENRDLVIRTKKKEYKIPFPGSSKEIYEDKFNKELDKYDFYYKHILDKENVLSQELKKLYELYNDNIDVLEDLKNHRRGPKENRIEHPLKKFAYYFFAYYKGCFVDKPNQNQIKAAISHYERIFKKISEAKSKSNNKKIDQEFEKALYDIKVSNIEFIPYRSFDSKSLRNLHNLESSNLSVKILIKKILGDKDTIVILRSIKDWKTLFNNICNEEGIDFEKDIAPSLYTFSSTQNAAISKGNIAPYKVEKDGNIKSVDEVIEKIRDIISLKDFEAYLDDIIANNNKGYF